MTMLFGKTILITGVASGIGARTAELAGQLGADVIGVDVREPAGPVGSFVKADISSKAGVDDLVDREGVRHGARGVGRGRAQSEAGKQCQAQDQAFQHLALRGCR